MVSINNLIMCLAIVTVHFTTCHANEFDDRAYYFNRANNGEADAQSHLGFTYGHQMSERFDGEKSKFWYCLAAQKGHVEAIFNIENKLGSDWTKKCIDIVRLGNEKGFSIYYESGMNLGVVKLKEGKEITYTVPSERFWRVEWRSPICPKVCKSDLRIVGKIYTDDQKVTSAYGVFNLDSLSSLSAVWLFPKTELTVNIDGAMVIIEEYVQ